jgi:hypothetical protein
VGQPNPSDFAAAAPGPFPQSTPTVLLDEDSFSYILADAVLSDFLSSVNGCISQSGMDLRQHPLA